MDEECTEVDHAADDVEYCDTTHELPQLILQEDKERIHIMVLTRTRNHPKTEYVSKQESELWAQVVQDTDKGPACQFATLERTDTIGTQPECDVGFLIEEAMAVNNTVNSDMPLS
jgi:hypothetical protein